MSLESIQPIVENLIAEAIFAGAATGTAWAVLRRKQTGLAEMLGARSERGLTLVLPRIVVKPAGTDGGYRQIGFAGDAVSRSEFEACVNLRDRLRHPFLRFLGPMDLAAAADGSLISRTTFSPVEDEMRAAFKSERIEHLPAELRQGSLVCFGGPVYNLVTKFALRLPGCQMVPKQMSVDGEWGVEVVAGSQANLQYSGRDSPQHRDLCLIQAVDGGPSGTRITIFAGSGDAATQVGVSYFAKNWRKIRRLAGSKPYAILLSVDLLSRDAYVLLGLVDGKTMHLG